MSSALQARHRWTYSDSVALPDDQMRHELIDGEHFVLPSPATTHQEILQTAVSGVRRPRRATPPRRGALRAV